MRTPAVCPCLQFVYIFTSMCHKRVSTLEATLTTIFLLVTAVFGQDPFVSFSMDSSKSQTLESCLQHQHKHKLNMADENTRKNERVQRGQWVRAAILGATDGLLSTTSLMLGVGAAKEDRRSMVLSGLAGALAGACSMAVGEFVSVSTQRDIEKATATAGLSKFPITATPTKLGLGETNELTPPRDIFCGKTCEPTEKISSDMVPVPRLPPIFSPGRSPMMKVITEDNSKANITKIPSPAIKVITKDATTTTLELWEENGEEVLPNPFKAATASALAFLCGSFVPLLPAILFAQYVIRMVVIAIMTSIALALFGGFAAHLGGSHIRISTARVLVGGWIAMGITYGLLKPFDSNLKGSDGAE